MQLFLLILAHALMTRSFSFDNRSYEKGRFKIQIFDDVASGSPQFSKIQLHSVINRLQKKRIVIVDLRQEFHWFIRDRSQWIPFNLFEPNFPYNRNKNKDAIIAEEKKLCQDINRRPYVDILHITQKCTAYHVQKSEKVRIDHRESPFCLTEEQLIRKYFSESCFYYRIPIQDHFAPDEQVLDMLKRIIEKHPKDWIHLHCKGGVGRTSLLLLLIDILKHKRRFTFKEYVRRQVARGGANLWKCKYRARLKKVETIYNKVGCTG